MTTTNAHPAADQARRRRWIHWLVVAGTLALLVALARHVDWLTTWQAVRRADPTFLVLAVVFDLASLTVKGVRWGLLLRTVGESAMAAAIRATVVGAALNNVLVASGGDAARTAIAARKARVSTADAVGALAVDRFCDLAAYVALIGALALGAPLPEPFTRWRTAAIVALVAITLWCVALVSRGKRLPIVPAEDAASGDPASASPLRRALPAIRRFARRLASVTASVAAGRRLGFALGLSLLVWIGQWVTFHLAARAVGWPISTTTSLLALLVVNATFLVRVTPANVGIFQVLYVLVASTAGLDRNRAVAAALLIQLLQYIPVTLIGLLLAPSVTRDGRLVRPASRATTDAATTPNR